MKMKKLLALAGTAVLAASMIFANELTFSIGVEAAYYPYAKHLVTGTTTPASADAAYTTEANHFSPICGPFAGAEGRITPRIGYTIDTPLGENWLVSGANLYLEGFMGITPISLNPGFKVSFTPVPFLVFSAGGEAGTGWAMESFGWCGLGVYDASTNTYKDAPFAMWNLKWWAQATFQFDTGAIIQGDWTHVLMQYSYQVYQEICTGATTNGSPTDIWIWNNGGNKGHGLREYMNAILGYQLPIPVLKVVGVMFESDRAYSLDAYPNAGFDATFAEISLSPLAQLKFDDHNSLNVLFHFKSRRTFDNYRIGADGKNAPEYVNNTTGREWFFNRLALSYTYKF